MNRLEWHLGEPTASETNNVRVCRDQDSRRRRKLLGDEEREEFYQVYIEFNTIITGVGGCNISCYCGKIQRALLFKSQPSFTSMRDGNSHSVCQDLRLAGKLSIKRDQPAGKRGEKL